MLRLHRRVPRRHVGKPAHATLCPFALLPSGVVLGVVGGRAETTLAGVHSPKSPHSPTFTVHTCSRRSTPPRRFHAVSVAPRGRTAEPHGGAFCVAVGNRRGPITLFERGPTRDGAKFRRQVRGACAPCTPTPTCVCVGAPCCPHGDLCCVCLGLCSSSSSLCSGCGRRNGGGGGSLCPAPLQQSEPLIT